MPTVRTKDLNQTATYWAPGGNTGFGDRGFATPVLIACRWQDKMDLIRTVDGKEVVSSAIAYVDRDLSVEGFLALGDFNGELQPPNTAVQVLNKGSSPDLSNTEVLLKVWL